MGDGDGDGDGEVVVRQEMWRVGRFLDCGIWKAELGRRCSGSVCKSRMQKFNQNCTNK